MKMILSSRRHHCLARVSIFLVTVALIGGIVGCNGGGGEYYSLSISSTVGGSVIEPGEGPSLWSANTMVNLVAEPDGHYHFVEWTGDVGTIADVEAAETTITMNDSCSITANFELDEGWYILSISSNVGGLVTEPGEGVFPCSEGTVVDLVAEAEGGYQFLKWTGDVGNIADVNDATTTITMDDNYSITANFGWANIIQVAAGVTHTVGVKSDGTVVAVGWNDDGQCNVGNWTDIVQVAAGKRHTVGLKVNGTVVAVGDNDEGQCNVGNWTDITQVAACTWSSVGLKDGGTVVAVGWNGYGQCNVGNWTDITQIAADYAHTVGLKDGGTVVAVGLNSWGQCDVGNWTDITQVAAGTPHTVGVRFHGTVVAVGRNEYGACNVGGWTHITQVAAGKGYTVGLKDDDTVVAVGYNNHGQCNVGGWTDIIQVATGNAHTVGLKNDGTVVAVGYNKRGQCNVGA